MDRDLGPYDVPGVRLQAADTIRDPRPPDPASGQPVHREDSLRYGGPALTTRADAGGALNPVRRQGRGNREHPAVSAPRRAYGGRMADVLHHTYLPFTADQLREHFAPVLGPGERDRHLRYYLASVEEAGKYDELIRGGDRPTPAQTRLGQADGERRTVLAGHGPHEPVSRRWRLRPGRAVRPPARASRAPAPTLCVPRISSVTVTYRVVFLASGRDDHRSCACGSSSAWLRGWSPGLRLSQREQA
jgi:hypothetical protein